jgi:hydroxymethylpyrimidine kinase/phosphomethylpyrimidine kinase
VSVPPVALSIAGSDSGGGAGVEMDLKVFAALGVFGACAITTLTAQNTVGVLGAWEAPSGFVSAQIAAVLDDLPVAAVKTGMLSSESVVAAVVTALEGRPFGPLVVDPVLVAKDGSRLLSEAGLAALRDSLLPCATLVTPNLPEVEALTGLRVSSASQGREAAARLLGQGCGWVLIKGGHAEGEAVTDVLVGSGGAEEFSSPRLPGGPYHGTGCALSAAIAALLAQGRSVIEAVREGRGFVHQLVRSALRLGRGALVLHPQAGAASSFIPTRRTGPPRADDPGGE